MLAVERDSPLARGCALFGRWEQGGNMRRRANMRMPQRPLVIDRRTFELQGWNLLRWDKLKCPASALARPSARQRGA